MIYIKLDAMMNLTITRNGPVHRGDNLFENLIYLIPKNLNGIDPFDTDVCLSYIRPDGVADIVTLEPLAEMYNEGYYQYVIPVTMAMTKYPGEIRTWLIIVEKGFEPEESVIAKSDECIIRVMDSENLRNLFDDDKVDSLFQITDADLEHLEVIDGGWIIDVYGGEKYAGSKGQMILNGELDYIVDGGNAE